MESAQEKIVSDHCAAPQKATGLGSIVSLDSVSTTHSSTSAQDDATVEIASALAADDAHLVSQVTALVNTAYAEAETGIFLPSYRRTSPVEIARFIQQGDLALACLGRRLSGASSSVSDSADQAGGGGRQVIGCVYIKRLSPTLGNFSMLALDARFRGGGLGTGLVRFAERHCRELGCTTVQLELLVPTSFAHAVKLRLQAWYLRMGYRIVRLGSFEQDYPDLVPLLTGPADFRIFEKDISSPVTSREAVGNTFRSAH
ncbi:hypothetical protein G6O67_001305 [Ophiocordyceps sinensis]|uniref:N-acetyltransferase domain-containing protein n=1 Tax=Ophiocordyceps sinensis TaxID=72228 RepID=A0A8H4PX62_9HYPO|nr:hypothetical protein G6O67_001305 [Ophiocordyceps sinensis]